ncbi:transposase [Kitasatospora sp. NPDC018058]|uniref:IS110 family transposase n=1 Tax=Kitasatospora sp. NPDC018058 TaxID=3364025 RepID=UPI0037C1AE14
MIGRVRRERVLVLFIGDDWAEDHHDVEVQDATGRRLAAARLPEGVEGVAKLHALIARHGGEELEPGQVVVGIETDRGPWVQALVAAGYRVYAVNPRQAARFKERYGTSGAKSDKGDAHALADMVRIDGAQLRTVAGDSDRAQAVRVVAPAHSPDAPTRRPPETHRCERRAHFPWRAAGPPGVGPAAVAVKRAWQESVIVGDPCATDVRQF